jgi:parallel beta-helix repeat protein
MLSSKIKYGRGSSSIFTRKCVVVLLTVLLFLGAIIGTFTVQVSGATIIQDLIDAPHLPGDIINVPSGTYNENVIVNKEVTLIGENNEDTIIVGDGSGNTVTVTANNVVISGFTIKNGGSDYPQAGVFLEGLENVQITNNIVSENNGLGVFVMWGTNNLISNNTIRDNGWSSNAAGIRVDGVYSPATLGNNTIMNNAIGIFLYSAHDVVVGDNTLVSNNAGITVQGDSRNVLVKNNTIEMATTMYGIEFYDSFDSTVENNTVTNTGGNGVVIEGGSAFLTLSDNNIYDNFFNGLTLRDRASNNDVTSNLITGNHQKGIQVDADCLYNRLTENTITSNYQEGVYLNEASYVMIRGNVITNNGFSGINAVSSEDSGVIQNQITENSFGIQLDTSSRISIVENILGQEDIGVNLLSSHDCWVTKNSISDNNAGIVLRGPDGSPANNNLTGNQLDNNNMGIMLDNSQSNILRANTLTNNYGTGGLYIADSSASNMFTQNNFVGNSLHVFVSDASVSNNFDGNYWDNYTAPPPHIINATLGVQDNSPLNDIWIYLPVHNTFTDLYYPTIQEAIDDGATSDGDFITVENGVYNENVNVYKSVQLVGTSPQGTLIDGNHFDALSVSPGTSNVVIQNFAITNGSKGIFLYGTQNAIVTNNFVYSNDVFGIHEDQCSGTFILGNRVVNSGQNGVYISGSSFPPLATNYIEYNHGSGIVLIDVNDSTIWANAITHNTESGLISDMDCDNLMIVFNVLKENWVNGFLFAHTKGSIIFGNTAMGNHQDGFQFFECSNMTISSNEIVSNGAAGIFLSTSSNNNVVSNNVAGSDQGIRLEYSANNNNVTQNTIANSNNNGLLVQFSSNQNKFSNNTITHNSGDGIQLHFNADNNLISENLVLESGAEGMRLLETSIHNTIVNNTVIGSGGDGIGLESHSSQNDIINNYVKDSNWYGIHPHGGTDPSDHITDVNIIGNTLENNEVGVILTNAWDCRVFNNNFLGNRATQAAIEGTSSGNAWDDGYPSGGNFWNDYSGVDQYHGAAQNLVGSDGIGDTAYTISAPSDLDNYPLFNLFNPTELLAMNFTFGGQPIPIIVTTNVTITATGSTPGALNFTVTGPSGETGYVRAIIPADATNANLKVLVNGTAVAYPFPTIETNGTHYFVYTEFTLSTHEVLFIFVVPEYTLGGLLALASCFAAFGVYKIRKKHVHT